MNGSKVMAIFMNGWILPFGGVSSEGVCSQAVKLACFLSDGLFSVSQQALNFNMVY